MNSRRSTLLSIGLAASLLLAACGSSSSSSSSSGTTKPTGAPATISAVLFSTPQAAYDATEAQWKKTTVGGNVTFQSSYGASGDQSRAVDSGTPALAAAAFIDSPSATCRATRSTSAASRGWSRRTGRR